MTRDDLVEAVARAIDPKLFADRDQVAAECPEFLPTYSGWHRIEEAKAAAQAAIAATLLAIREPTTEMVKAMDELAGTINPTDTYQLAIDALLASLTPQEADDGQG